MCFCGFSRTDCSWFFPGQGFHVFPGCIGSVSVALFFPGPSVRVQVKRELKWRGGAGQREYDDSAKEEWAKKVTAFCQARTTESLPDKRRRLKYTTQTKPRLATLHWLQDMSNGLRNIGLSWSHFLNPSDPNADKAEEPNFRVACTDRPITNPNHWHELP